MAPTAPPPWECGRSPERLTFTTFSRLSTWSGDGFSSIWAAETVWSPAWPPFSPGRREWRWTPVCAEPPAEPPGPFPFLARRNSSKPTISPWSSVEPIASIFTPTNRFPAWRRSSRAGREISWCTVPTCRPGTSSPSGVFDAVRRAWWSIRVASPP